MSELYWLTRCDSLNTLGIILLVAGLIASIVIGGVLIASSIDCDEDGISASKKLLKFSLPILIFGALMVIFIPTTKEALLIYGVGGTIDYIKSNKTAKQLPDKCIKALDKWVDKCASGEKQNKEEE